MGAQIFNYIFLIIAVLLVAAVVKRPPLGNGTKPSMGYSGNSNLNFTATAARDQYMAEEHTVVTEDGYILTVFRIIKSKNCQQKNKIRPVLIMHGLWQNSDSILDAGPSAGLAYLISDSCYDVWIGNQRGNNYGRRHLRLNPDKDVHFWRFSVDEIGFYDVPATVHYILNRTGADKLNYIGYSQGCGIYFVMCSERPSYCKRVGVMIALAPAIILKRLKSPVLRFTLQNAVRFENVFDYFGIHEILSKGSLYQELVSHLCQFGWSWTERFCVTLGLLDNYNPGSISPDTWKVMNTNFPVGTSLKNLARHEQAIASGKFQKYNYGEKMNLERYNSTHAPEYNLQDISVPVVIILGQNDTCVDIQDFKIVSKQLPNMIEMVEVSNWTHLDMVYSKNIKTVIYPKINEYLQMYSAESDE